MPQHQLITYILNKKLNAFMLIYMVLMSFLVGFDAFLKVIKPSYTETGSFNFIIGVIILSLHIFLYFNAYYRITSNPVIKQEIYSFLLGAILLVVLFGNSLGYFELGKVVRDVFYSFYFIFIFYFLFYYYKTQSNKFNAFLNLSFFSYFIIFNILGVAFGSFDHEGRFTGMQMAASIYGGTACLLLITLCESQLSKYPKVIYFIIGFLFLLLSGTRGAVLSLLVYFAFVFYRTFGKNKFLQLFILLIVSTIISFIVLKFEEITAAMSALSSLRFVSTADLEGGSLGTRLTWYLMILTDLYENSMLGGFGGGAAEKLTGHITHFDLLRFWYDYGIIFVLMQLVLFAYMIRSINSHWVLIFIYFFVQYLLFSLHNIFQAPAMLFVFALSLVVLSHPHKPYNNE